MGSRWSAASRICRSASQKTVSDGLCPGRCSTSSLRSRSSSDLAVGERPGDPGARAPGTEAPRDALQGDHDVLGNPAAQHQLRREPVVELGVLGEVREPPGGEAERGDVGARVLDDDLDQPEVVDVLVGDDHELEIVDRVAPLGQLVLELVERLAGVRARVDQRERLVLDQVAVDPADGERRGDAQAVDARFAAARARASSGVTDQREDLVALALHVLARDQRFEVEPQERLGVRRANVEVPVRVVDGDAVEPR